jgi:hypothetical protein
MNALALLLPATLVACAAASDPPAPLGDEDKCRAEAAAPLVGRKLDPHTQVEARRLSGAGTVRVIRPGEPVTGEYMTGRLTIDLGPDGRIAGFRCD